MAEPRGRNLNPQSPKSSSGGAESLKGTPDTRFTNPRPDAVSASSTKLPRGMGISADATAPFKFLATVENSHAFTSTDKDPFVAPSSALRTTLCPTASVFDPHDKSLHSHTQKISPENSLSRSGPGLGSAPQLRISSIEGLAAAEVESWLQQCDLRGSSRHEHQFAVTSDDGHVYVHFADLKDAAYARDLIISERKEWTAKYVGMAHKLSQDEGQDFNKLGPLPLPPRSEGKQTAHGHSVQHHQIMAQSMPQPGSYASAEQVAEITRRFLESCGQLRLYAAQMTDPGTPHMVVFEFHDPAVEASIVAAGPSGILVQGVHILITPIAVNERASPRGVDVAFGDMTVSNGWEHDSRTPQLSRGLTKPPGTSEAQFRPQLPYYHLMLPSPYASASPYTSDGGVAHAGAGIASTLTPVAPVSPSYPMFGSMFRTPPSPAMTARQSLSPSRSLSSLSREPRRHNATRISRSSYHGTSSHHNHVDVNRIRDGIDVRTTIMLRNIPNKVDQAMLKRIVDESSWGKYDFMYLRIDFANECNVGYAFINFVDPLDIIDFVHARGNQRWNCFKSDKVAEISYATIQGKDCLVQKFRNSSVMLEAPHYRPKLYFTLNGPVPDRAGHEEPFPEPDNQSKMKRSCENAEHVGLFTPNAGQHFRDEQRRRRSQYDRGTRLAALEEYDCDAALQQLYTQALQ